MKPGEKFTIAGVYAVQPNPDRLWWHFWKPRVVSTGVLQTFTVMP